MFENFKNVWPKMYKKCTGVLYINLLTFYEGKVKENNLANSR